ncbi:MAG TPA: folylpolyglutamate synthase/dihydrofolate synthase family protein [Bacteroidales bacterium]|nr:folylpolyglutamate synthase/dihydrofolate synthase family protein [Bacteroidales bacterium]
MNYQKTLDYLLEQLPLYQRTGKLAYRTGLENTYLLDSYFKSPHRNIKTIHVAGTNGKGSVSHMLASVLQESGYTVGLYTSPHLLDFRERIKVNGKLISKNFVSGFVESHRPFFGTFNPSFFEISVFMAFCHFAACKVDIAVIEVGLGGRLDATNIISPVLSVITNIGKDHTEILGETLEKIAGEKAGIIKPNTPVVVGESQPETLPVFRQVSSQREAPLHIADEIYEIPYSMKSMDGFQVFNVVKNGAVCFPNLKCGLLGHYQRKNTVTLLSVLDQLKKSGYHITEKSIYAGIRNVITNTGLTGRWQIVQHQPDVVCDTAHNADGLKQVMQQIIETPHEHLHIILGFVNDKDIHEIFNYLPEEAAFYFTRLSVPRTMSENDLASLANNNGFTGQSFTHVKDAFEAAKEKAGINDLILITGSNFLVADFLTIIK